MLGSRSRRPVRQPGPEDHADEGILARKGAKERAPRRVRSPRAKARTRVSPDRTSITKLKGQIEARDRLLAEERKHLAEALDQQSATAEVLRAISSSPTDVEAVLTTIAESAARLLHVTDADIMRVEGDLLKCVATYGPSVTWSIGATAPHRNRDWVTGRAVIDRITIHVPDLLAAASEFPQGAAYARQYGHRTTLATPLLREGSAIGAILIRRVEVKPLTEKQIALLKIFADRGSDRDRERPPTQRAARIPAAADRDRRGVADHQPLGLRPQGGAADADLIGRPTVRRRQGHHHPAARWKVLPFQIVQAFPRNSWTMSGMCRWSRKPGTATGRALLEGKVVQIPHMQERIRITHGRRLIGWADFAAFLVFRCCARGYRSASWR